MLATDRGTMFVNLASSVGPEEDAAIVGMAVVAPCGAPAFPSGLHFEALYIHSASISDEHLQKGGLVAGDLDFVMAASGAARAATDGKVRGSRHFTIQRVVKCDGASRACGGDQK